MSLFRKPTKKIQRRVFASVDDEEDGEPEPPPPPIISKQKKGNKPVKCAPLLSFVDEEEEGEMFKVKKSSQSKRLAKKRDKEKQITGDSKYENNISEDKIPESENVPEKPKKKVTLEGLILSGREALAADGAGDLSDEEMVEDEEEQGGFHQYRAESVRAALAAGGDGIPDAALIHAARKTRQQARELGGDYIPVRAPERAGGRLTREDESGDEDEGRIHVVGLDVPSDKPKRGTAAAPTTEELDSDAEQWEEQQMNKAKLAIADECEVNPFAVAPPPPRLDETPAHLRPLATGGTIASASDLLDALRHRLEELQMARDVCARQRTELGSQLQSAAQVRESREARRGPLEAAYRRAQAARAYVTDLVECLDEKMPQLEALEGRALTLHKSRCEFLQERRRTDVQDEMQDVLALAARPGAARAPEPEEKVRRAAERAGRRRARRLRRGGAPHRDGDSSDDAPPPATQQRYHTTAEEIRRESEQLFSDALGAWGSLRGVCSRLARWRRREPDAYRAAYMPECLPRLLAPYVRHQLILWNPLADEDNEDYERMDWYKCLMMYGVRPERVADDSDVSSDEEAGPGPQTVTEDATADDPDRFLVPVIMQKVVLPKITELVEAAWDPMCVRACVRLRGLLARVSVMPGGAAGRDRAALRALGAAARRRLAASVALDVTLPALPTPIMEGGGGPFWRRCLGAGVRLLRAALALCAPPPQLRADPLVLRLVGVLCSAAAAAPATAGASAAAALASTLPRGGGGGAGGEPRTSALRLLAELARRLLTQLDSDNPLHLKAIEECKSVLAEARTCENQE